LAEDPGQGIGGLGESQIPKRAVAGAMFVVKEAEVQLVLNSRRFGLGQFGDHDAVAPSLLGDGSLEPLRT
jgi:hypothetical protein